MADFPADLAITRHAPPGQSEFIRIEARDGAKVLVQLDMSPSDFTAVILGQLIVARLNMARLA